MPGGNSLPSPRFWFPPPSALPLKSSMSSSMFSPLTFRNPAAALDPSTLPGSTRYPVVPHMPNPFNLNPSVINPMLSRHNFPPFPNQFNLPPQQPSLCPINPFTKDLPSAVGNLRNEVISLFTLHRVPILITHSFSLCFL